MQNENSKMSDSSELMHSYAEGVSELSFLPMTNADLDAVLAIENLSIFIHGRTAILQIRLPPVIGRIV